MAKQHLLLTVISVADGSEISESHGISNDHQLHRISEVQ
jgi:hypothetical protein